MSDLPFLTPPSWATGMYNMRTKGPRQCPLFVDSCGGAGWDQDTSVSLCSFSAVKDIVLQRMCVAPIEVSGTHWDVPVWCVAGEKGRVLPQAT